MIVASTVVAASCAPASKNIQPQINSLTIARRYDKALQLMGDNALVYGQKNQLLFWLDRGMVAHLAGQYQLSIDSLEQAKQLYDQLYTRSVTQMTTSWLVNDYTQDYRGEDYEYVMLHMIQALNYAAMGNIDEALVDARAVDFALAQIKAKYKEAADKIYQDDGFARLLSGILWQATNTPEGWNDAYIAYQKAMSLYEQPPDILTRNLAAAKAYMEQGVKLNPNKAFVYVIDYGGLIPVKVSDALIVPIHLGAITKMSFPKYANRFSEFHSSLVKAQKQEGWDMVQPAELVQDLGGVARKSLEGKKAYVYAKAGLRPLMKTAAQTVAQHQIRNNGNDLAAGLAMVVADVYNLATEEADLRSWQTLPGQIHLASFELDPGTYHMRIEDRNSEGEVIEQRDLGTIKLTAGETRFLITRSWR